MSHTFPCASRIFMKSVGGGHFKTFLELKEFTLEQKRLKFMHNFFMVHIFFHELFKTPSLCVCVCVCVR